VQDGTPMQLLAQPSGDFVRAFFGGDELGLRLLALQRVGDRMRIGEQAAGEPLAHTASLREALAAFVVRAATRLPVADADSGRLLGAIEFSDLFAQRAAPVAPLPP
jgi:osmoprotectant transport system ATP-binding protein